MSNVIQLQEKDFDDLINNNRFVLVDFAADWCAPCKSFAKVINNLAPEYPDFIFASVNIEEEKQLAEEFEVRSIPFIMILRDRVIVFMETGAMAESVLRDLLDQTRALKPELLKINNEDK